MCLHFVCCIVRNTDGKLRGKKLINVPPVVHVAVTEAMKCTIGGTYGGKRVKILQKLKSLNTGPNQQKSPLVSFHSYFTSHCPLTTLSSRFFPFSHSLSLLSFLSPVCHEKHTYIHYVVLQTSHVNCLLGEKNTITTEYIFGPLQSYILVQTISYLYSTVSRRQV